MTYFQPVVDWYYWIQTKSGILILAIVIIISTAGVIFGGASSGPANFIQKALALFAMLQIPVFIIFILMRNFSDNYHSMHMFSSFTIFIFLFMTVALILLSTDFRNNIAIGILMTLFMSFIISGLFTIFSSLMKRVV